MSLIGCTEPCLYQQDGRCTLMQLSAKMPTGISASGGGSSCANFVPRDLQNSRQRFPDVAHPDEL